VNGSIVLFALSGVYGALILVRGMFASSRRGTSVLSSNKRLILRYLLLYELRSSVK